ncbi:MAG: aldehyde-activating protein [Hyphomicrobiales bacterium]|nr:MAG: aldehyde-activating protein [Hyphomicrobiales bacterium]
MSNFLSLRGGCQCGQVRYEITKPPLTLYCCHCTQCQTQAASAFGMSLRISSDSLKFSGETSAFRRDAEKTTEVECVFCPYCGTRIFHRRNVTAANCSVKAGTLDDKSRLNPVGHIWVNSKQDWVILPTNALTYETQPNDGYAALIEAYSLQQTKS